MRQRILKYLYERTNLVYTEDVYDISTVVLEEQELTNIKERNTYFVGNKMYVTTNNLLYTYKVDRTVTYKLKALTF